MIVPYLFLKSFLFTILSIVNVIGYSSILNKSQFELKKNCIFSKFIYGSIFITIISFFLNFFTSLNIFITNTFFIIFTLIGYLKFKKLILDNLKLIILVGILSSLMTIFSNPYNDYELYHLPYMNLIRESKIIFGLSNFDFRYAHTSVFQNIAAFQYNNLMGVDSYIFYTTSLFLISLNFLYKLFKNTNSTIIYLIAFISLIYFIIHGNRYGALGNDYPTHILSIISIILYLEIKNDLKLQKDKWFLFLSLITILILSKFSMIFFILLPLNLILKNKFILLNKSLYLFFFVGLLFLTKNFINSSCLVYPIPTLCLNTDWSVNEISFGSPKTISIQSSASVKAFMESDYFLDPMIKQKFLDSKSMSKNFSNHLSNLSLSERQELIDYEFYLYYLKNKIWIKEYFKSKSFIKFLERIVLLNVIIFFIIVFNYKRNNESVFILNRSITIIKENLFFLIFIIFNFIFWFFNFPQLRYAISYVLIFISIPSLLFFGLHRRDILTKPFMYIIIIALTYSISFNLIRIYNASYSGNEFNKLDNNIVPLQNKIYLKEYSNIDNFVLFQPINGVCSNTPPLCSVFTERFLKTGRSIKKGPFNYIFIR